jgi:hypothetical protein
MKMLSLDEIAFIRKRFLNDLLINDIKNMKDYTSKFNELDINIDMENLIVIIFKIDSLENFYDKYSLRNDRNLIRFGIKNIITEVLSNKFSIETIIIDNTIASILSIKQEIDTTIFESIINSIKDIQKSTYKTLNVSLSSSIGDFAKHISKISSRIIVLISILTIPLNMVKTLYYINIKFSMILIQNIIMMKM